MEEPVYLISEAARLAQVKEHVLRYWEEELNLPIKRNKMGHRYYTGQDIQTFLSIKELKTKGLQLRAIKELLPKICEQEYSPQVELIQSKEAESQGLQSEEQADVIEVQVLESEMVAESESEDKKQRFNQIMERLIQQVLQTNRQEVRCKRLDEAIRQHQQIRREAAATKEKGRKRKKWKR